MFGPLATWKVPLTCMSHGSGVDAEQLEVRPEREALVAERASGLSTWLIVVPDRIGALQVSR